MIGHPEGRRPAPAYHFILGVLDILGTVQDQLVELADDAAELARAHDDRAWALTALRVRRIIVCVHSAGELGAIAREIAAVQP